MRVRAALLLAWVSGASTAACLGDTVVAQTGAAACRNDADCPGATCDASTRRCVSTARAEVFFAVSPAAGRANAYAYPTLTRPRTIAADESVDLALGAPRAVFGVVTAPDPQGGAALYVPATLEFAPSGLAGVQPPVECVADGAPMLAASRDRAAYTWTTTLTSGLFDVVVRPASAWAATVPPRFEAGFEVRDGIAAQRFDLAYPAAYVSWDGAMRTTAGAALAGFAVRAVDPATDERVVSTVSASGADGAFTCRLAPGSPDAWSLRLTTDDGHGGSLAIDVPRATLEAAAAGGRRVTVTVGDLAGLPAGMIPATATPPRSPSPGAPCAGCVDVRASAEGVDARGRSQALAGASVTFRTAVAAPSGLAGSTAWFTSTVETDGAGSLRAWLIPGDYDVTVTPRGELYRSAMQHGFRVRGDAATQAGQVFSASARPSVLGRVLGRDGLAVRNARVTAVPYGAAAPNDPCLADADVAALAEYTAPSGAVTVGDGSFRIDVNPGLYRLLIEPPENSGLPVTLSASVCVAQTVMNLDTSLEAPVQVQGTVRDASGAVAPGATIEALVRLRSGTAPGVVARVGSATADARGRYTLLVPASAARTD